MCTGYTVTILLAVVCLSGVTVWCLPSSHGTEHGTGVLLAPLCLLPPSPVQPGTASGLGLPEGAWCLAQLVLEDFAFFGDGCIFLDMVSALVHSHHCMNAHTQTCTYSLGGSPACVRSTISAQPGQYVSSIAMCSF